MSANELTGHRGSFVPTGHCRRRGVGSSNPVDLKPPFLIGRLVPEMVAQCLILLIPLERND
jgi:hypothetical protein